MSDLAIDMRITVEGMGWDALGRSFRRIEDEIPDIVDKAAAEGEYVILDAIRKTAPLGKTGYLRRSIIPVQEHNRSEAKQVYQTTFDYAYNDVLQKAVWERGKYGGKYRKSWHAYYPASQEYGFLARKKGGGVQLVPGKYFMRDAAETAADAAFERMADTLSKELDKAWEDK